MKKISIVGMAMLVASVAFVSCSKTDMFEENKQYLAEQEKNEYRTNFVQMYGEVAADQSWDFCTTSSTQANTRAGESLTWGVLFPLTTWTTSFVNNDLAGVKSMIDNAEVKTFNPYLAVDMFASYTYVARNNEYDYYNLAVCYNNQTEDLYNIGIFEKSGWCTLGRWGREINAKSLTTANNVYWTLYPKKISGLFSTKIVGKVEDYKIDSYKEITVNGRTYWGFRCGPNGSYSDLICMVRNIDPVRPIAKRYMIEDLGSKRDFDFNDIVVDVYQAINGSQRAVIRAMGGTIDFTLEIGKTKWQKSVDGVAAGYDTDTWYNTTPNPVWDDVLAEFPVEGWEPENNNITVTVGSVTNDGVIIKIPFPRVGEVPMIIALDTFVDWQKEKDTLPKDWWVPAKETTENAE